MALSVKRSAGGFPVAFLVDTASGEHFGTVTLQNMEADPESAVELARWAATAPELLLAIDRLAEEVESRIHHFPPGMAAAFRSRIAFARAAQARARPPAAPAPRTTAAR
jgi:hypothetical protein